MNYDQLKERLPELFDMLLIASESAVPEGPAAGISWAVMPLRIREMLSLLDEITYRAMMGEYIIYYRGKIVGGIYDDRFLVKQTKSALALMPEAGLELPYEGAKEMILVEEVDNREFLKELLDAMYPELPASKKK